MTSLILWALFSIQNIYPSWGISEQNSNEQKLILFLMDGFRWDYLDNFYPDLAVLPGFDRLVNNGVKATFLKPDFTSSSYPNYYTLMTGLHQENHGFVHNYMYDPIEDEEFLIGSNEEQYNAHWWEDAEPFWISSELAGKPVHMWYWCGCEVEIFGTKPTFCLPYQQTGRPTLEEFDYAISEAIKALVNNSATTAAIYYEELDALGHSGGPDSDSIAEYLSYIDNSLAKMFDQLDETNLTNSVNIMMFADHGMMFSPLGQSINLFDYISRNDYERQLGSSAVRQIWPYEGDESRIYELLKDAHPNMQVYLKKDIPELWHYRNHRRVPPILLVADLGWQIALGIGYPGGVHGYENTGSDMDGVFYAQGPLFKSGYVSPGIEAIELYQLMCHVIALEPLAHNGTWSNVSDMLL